MPSGTQKSSHAKWDPKKFYHLYYPDCLIYLYYLYCLYYLYYYYYFFCFYCCYTTSTTDMPRFSGGMNTPPVAGMGNGMGMGMMDMAGMEAGAERSTRLAHMRRGLLA